jgi:hypothetical protein
MMHPAGGIVVTSTLTALALKGATPNLGYRQKRGRNHCIKTSDREERIWCENTSDIQESPSGLYPILEICNKKKDF